LWVALTGDAEVVARKVARQVGIAPEDVYAEVKPAGKKDVVEQLQAEGRRVAMVGDGFNDTAALAQADVGMAMGSGLTPASEVGALSQPRLSPLISIPRCPLHNSSGEAAEEVDGEDYSH
jgi:P-type Cu+ transporter